MASNSAPKPSTSSRGSSPVLPSSPLSPIITNGIDASYTSSALPPIIEHVRSDHSDTRPLTHSRTASVSSIRFQDSPRGSQSPNGDKRRSSRGSRKDGSPPPPSKFQHHVSFDNFSGGKATEKNSISFTLNVKHTGYRYERRSRTFMVGIDENEYSDVALKWMLEELVDDGDEIICLRVIEKDAKIISDKNLERRQYQKAAKEMMVKIQAKNEAHRAISIVLEFAVGELHSTFQQMIQLHEPAMLIVGTRGRSLGGLQGLMGNRNSFSKWCLQYSPIPVVVVRPPEKREKKKKKRDADPSRQDYAKMLRDSGFTEHETEETARAIVFEAPNTPDVEAHMVNMANGLPSDFDPKFRPLTLEDDIILTNEAHHHTHAPISASQETLVGDSQPGSPAMTAADSDSQSGSDSSDSENEFETIDGRMLLANGEEERKKRLHEIELSEAQALRARAPKNEDEGAERGAEAARKVSVESVESELEAKRSSSDDDDSSERIRVRGDRKVSTASTASTASDISAVLGVGKGKGVAVEKVDSTTSSSSSSGDGEANQLKKELSDDSAISPGAEETPTSPFIHPSLLARGGESVFSPEAVEASSSSYIDPFPPATTEAETTESSFVQLLPLARDNVSIFSSDIVPGNLAESRKQKEDSEESAISPLHVKENPIVKTEPEVTEK